MNHVSRFLQMWITTSYWIETSPPRFIRRGRALSRKKDLDDDGPSDFEEIASDVEQTDDLRAWLSTRSFTTARLVPGESLVRKFLPPGTINDLYEHYRATQSMLGGPTVSQHICKLVTFGNHPTGFVSVSHQHQCQGMEHFSESTSGVGRTFLVLGRKAYSLLAKFARS